MNAINADGILRKRRGEETMKNIGEEVRKRLMMDCLTVTEYTGRVIYVHPSGRFYVAEFQLAGGTVRESFFE